MSIFEKKRGIISTPLFLARGGENAGSQHSSQLEKAYKKVLSAPLGAGCMGENFKNLVVCL
jgi:hypothetical protein